MNVIARLEFELTYYDSAVQRFKTLWRHHLLKYHSSKILKEKSSTRIKQKMVQLWSYFFIWSIFVITLLLDFAIFFLLIAFSNQQPLKKRQFWLLATVECERRFRKNQWCQKWVNNSTIVLIHQILHHGQDMTQGQFLNRLRLGLYSEFSLISLPYYERTNGLIPLVRVLVRSEMKTALLRIETQVTDSIFDSDNHYANS